MFSSNLSLFSGSFEELFWNFDISRWNIVSCREGDPSITLYDTATEVDVNINEALVLVTDQALVKPELPAVSWAHPTNSYDSRP